MNQPRMTARRLMALAAGAMLVCLLAGPMVRPVAADSMRVGKFWLPNFAPIEYNEGILVYNIGENEAKRPLSAIDGLKMDNYPTLAKAEDALKAGDDATALREFKTARVKAQEKWLQLWLDARVLPLLNKEGQGMDAGKTFLALMESGAPESLFIENPPIRSVASATKDQKLFLQTKFKEQMAKAKPKSAIWFALEELVEAADPAKTGGPANTIVTPEGALASQIPLPVFMLTGNPDSVTKLLARRQFERAKERLAELIKAAGAGKTSLFLYQMGIVELYLAEEAEKAGDADKAGKLYRDAGLLFMRVTIHFPRSNVAGPALIEAALIHVKIGRKDLAATLIKQADESVDPDDEILVKRLDKIREMVSN